MQISDNSNPTENSNTLISKHYRVRAYAILIGIFLLVVAIIYAVIKDAVNKTLESQAVTVAEIVATHAMTARSVYALKVADKLKQDGYGPHVNSDNMPGYVPLPVEFLKMTGAAVTEDVSELFHYQPVSKWNLQPNQGINDDFLAWAWAQLEAQDLQNPTSPVSWKPLWRFDLVDGKKTLRYLTADAAAHISCVNCHNEYENKPDIIARRVAAGVAPGKQWKLHQLLGALSVTIPLDKIENVASAQTQITTLLIFGILLISFLASIWFKQRLEKQGQDLSHLSWQATHDPLTKFLNRRGFEVEIKRFFKIAQANDEQHVVCIIDIDNFKLINDKYGHHAGDAMLKQLGISLPALVQNDDAIARLGGDEFAVLLKNRSEKQGRMVAESICRQVSELAVEADGQSIHTTASIGIAVMNSRSASTRTVLTAADIACYISKKNGKNQVYAYRKKDVKPDHA